MLAARERVSNLEEILSESFVARLSEARQADTIGCIGQLSCFFHHRQDDVPLDNDRVSFMSFCNTDVAPHDPRGSPEGMAW